MKLHNGKILCLEYSELVPVVISESAYKQAKLRGNITVHGRGGNGNSVLIEYETMPYKYKEAVREKYGNPQQYMESQPIKALIDWDHKAETFYSEYILPTGLKLPDDYVAKYSLAATWLNTIDHLTSDKRALKANLNKSIGEFWQIVTDLIRVENIQLPTHEKRLKEKLKAYKSEKYPCLIEAFRFGNSNSKKVDDDVAEALLIEMLSHSNQHDYTIVAARYNDWAIGSQKPTITASAVGYWAKKNAHLIVNNRDGKKVNYSKFNKQILRDRPSAPMLLLNSDDNVLDLFFQTEGVSKKGHNTKNPYYRPVLYVVTDAFNDYILGYAIGETVTVELIKEAYLNAANHVKHLLNGYYLPYQIQSDRWAIDRELKSPLAQFFQSIATYTPATLNVAQGKYIERSFGTGWHQMLKNFINYAGFNITAKSKKNADAIEKNKSNFPLKSEATLQVELFITALRCKVDPKTGTSKQTAWIDSFHASEKSKAKAISAEKHLQIFGKRHIETNSLRPEGLRVRLNGNQFIYDIPSEYFPYHVGKKVQVIYDPYDLNQVLVTDGKGLRFVATSFEKMPSALADHTTESRLRLNSLLIDKKRIANVPVQAALKRQEVLERANIDIESTLQSGTLIKQVRHAAEKGVLEAFEKYDRPQPEKLPQSGSVYDRI